MKGPIFRAGALLLPWLAAFGSAGLAEEWGGGYDLEPSKGFALSRDLTQYPHHIIQMTLCVYPPRDCQSE